jgi:CRP-like cAMP-binding protein
MLYSLEEFTRKYVNFSSAELIALASLFKPMNLKQDDMVIKKGEIVTSIYFLDNGILKSYLDKNGRCCNVKFYFKPIFFSDLDAICNGKETSKCFVTIRKANVFIAYFEDVIKLSAKSEKHKLFFRMIFEDHYMFD